MVVQALNSHPAIRCFGEVFNTEVDFVPFSVEGYDNFNDRDRALRDSDYVAFIRDRIFSPPPEGVRAVGFKLLYTQDWKFAWLSDWLVGDHDLRVIHLRRRNLLRTLVSARIARRTGVWVESRDVALSRTLTGSNLRRALRHPARALAALGRRLRLSRAAGAPAETVTMSVDDCRTTLNFVRRQEQRYDDYFAEHAKLTLFYEDLVKQPEELFGEIQSFLGVEPRPLEMGLRRQNPQPLRELLGNYDELREALRGTEYEACFE